MNVGRSQFVLDRIGERVSDGKKFQQWAFGALQDQVKHKAALAGVAV